MFFFPAGHASAEIQLVHDSEDLVAVELSLQEELSNAAHLVG